MNRKCEGCKWWAPTHRGVDSWAIGECRRRAPVAFPRVRPEVSPDYVDRTAYWPYTRAVDWCGDFEFQPNR